jgi:nucleoside-diphosphate-sugar epimerase
MKQILLIGGEGYIGSALVGYLVSNGCCITSVDWNRGTHKRPVICIQEDYRNLKAQFLSRYDSIILLAGHTSVRSAAVDCAGAFANNLVGFYNLIEMVNTQKFIYASTAGIYSGTGPRAARETWKGFRAHSMYDLTKFACDELATLSTKDYYGLRLGSVNGPSAKMRWDLIINQMVCSAIRDGRITIYNPSLSRAVLGVRDLCRVVRRILDGASCPGIYNIASFNARVGEIGQTVGRLLGAKIVTGGTVRSYDFRISTRKFRNNYTFCFSDTIKTIVRDVSLLLNNESYKFSSSPVAINNLQLQ